MIDILTLGYKEAALFVLKDTAGADIVDAGVTCKYKVKGPASRKHEDAWQIYKAESQMSDQDRPKAIIRARFLTAITERMDCSFQSLTGDDALMAMYSDPRTSFVADQVFTTARELKNFKP